MATMEIKKRKKEIAPPFIYEASKTLYYLAIWIGKQSTIKIDGYYYHYQPDYDWLIRGQQIDTP
jgi:hypothetical protein